METHETLTKVLVKHGYKVTAPRKMIYFALLEIDKPISNSELIKYLPKVDKVSVYRTISLFENVGLIHRVWNGFKSKVELAEEFSPHHHHFTCMECGSVQSFDDNRIEEALVNIENKLKVHIKKHLVELSGSCAKCHSDKTHTNA